MTATMFENWCAKQPGNVLPVPATPMVIARFVDSISPSGIEQVFEAVQEISRAHYTIGLPCPCSGPGLVTRAVNAVSKIVPPRSWSKAMQEQFLHLNWDIQSCIAKRETERELVVRKAQQEAGEARNALAALKQQMEKAA
jgi:hypothetical protein